MKRCLFLPLIILCVGKIQAGWICPDHYYLITSNDGVEYTSKGEPYEKGEYTIFTEWPDKKELKLKTDFISSIKDTGNLSPEEIDERNAKSLRDLKLKVSELFPNSDVFHYPRLVPASLAKAREMGASDEIIWEVLETTIDGKVFALAKAKHTSLDDIAADFQRREDQSPHRRDIFDNLAGKNRVETNN